MKKSKAVTKYKIGGDPPPKPQYKDFKNAVNYVYRAVDNRTETMWGITDEHAFVRGKRTRNDDREEHKEASAKW